MEDKAIKVNTSNVLPDDAFEDIVKEKQPAGTSYDRGLWYDICRSFKENNVALVCLIILIIIAIASLLAPLSPYDPDAIDATQKLLPPSKEHWFGTDDFGRDYFTRALYGGRVSLTVGLASMICTTIIGTLIGTFSGYKGGKLDMVLMRFTDIFLALPSFLLMVVLNTLFSPGMVTLIAVLSLFSWASVARITRAETMSLKQKDFVLAAKSMGASHTEIIFKHIIPNMSASIIVAGSLGVAGAILTESSLSFLGLGVQLPQSSWGSMLQLAQKYILDRPSMAVFPGLLILFTVLSFNIIGDVLRNALEPKMIK